MVATPVELEVEETGSYKKIFFIIFKKNIKMKREKADL